MKKEIVCSFFKCNDALYSCYMDIMYCTCLCELNDAVKIRTQNFVFVNNVSDDLHTFVVQSMSSIFRQLELGCSCIVCRFADQYLCFFLEDISDTYVVSLI